MRPGLTESPVTCPLQETLAESWSASPSSFHEVPGTSVHFVGGRQSLLVALVDDALSEVFFTGEVSLLPDFSLPDFSLLLSLLVELSDDPLLSADFFPFFPGRA